MLNPQYFRSCFARPKTSYSFRHCRRFSPRRSPPAETSAAPCTRRHSAPTPSPAALRASARHGRRTGLGERCLRSAAMGGTACQRASESLRLHGMGHEFWRPKTPSGANRPPWRPAPAARISAQPIDSQCVSLPRTVASDRLADTPSPARIRHRSGAPRPRTPAISTRRSLVSNSDQARSTERRRVLQASVGPQRVETPCEANRRVHADVSLEDLAVVPD